ncbi:dsDNA nuclease domain-containing protein [Azospirillum himalayense]|uniref:DsDNA nuclease domain-containing protein n=1 Tax=Azospirillum himalayense TaxID=654847 RepID=A0ABW0G936_9PROT
MTTASPDPGAVLDKTDPGADTQARFSYQHCFAALQCLRLLSGQLEAVYCENHEDILLRKPGGPMMLSRSRHAASTWIPSRPMMMLSRTA